MVCIPHAHVRTLQQPWQAPRSTACGNRRDLAENDGKVRLESGRTGGEGVLQDWPTLRRHGDRHWRGHLHDATPVASTFPVRGMGLPSHLCAKSVQWGETDSNDLGLLIRFTYWRTAHLQLLSPLGYSGGARNRRFWPPLHSKEGVTQRGPLTMLSYGIWILLLTHDICAAHTQVMQPWYTEDAGAGGKVEALHEHMQYILLRGPLGGHKPGVSNPPLYLGLPGNGTQNQCATTTVGGRVSHPPLHIEKTQKRKNQHENSI